MSQHLVTCPQCRTRLRSAQPIPFGSSLSCPDCKVSFTAPVATPGRFGPVAMIAVSVAVILGASVILAAALMNRTVPLPVANLHQSEEEAQQRKYEAQKREIEEGRKKLEVTRLLAQGDDALRKQQYAEAEEAYSRAADILPGESEALKGLVTARAALASAKVTTEEAGKRQAEIDRLLDQAKKATEDKQLAQAVRLLESARAISPTNRAVLDALAVAQTALDADQTQKKNLADFRKFMDTAKAALIAERYPDAVRDFQAALRLVPEDLEAQQGVKQAEAKLAGVADKNKRQQAFDAFLDRARNSHGTKRYNDAIAALESALRLIPDEREATRLLRGSRDALKEAKSKNAKLLALADEAIRLNRLEEGQRLADEAVKNWPEDTRAEKLLRSATQLVENTRAALTAFMRYIQAGAIATAAGRNADAVVAYTEALRLDPTSAEVMRLLRNANQALARDLKGQAEYDRLIKVGATALARKSYTDAGKAFQAALKLVPDDAVANDGLSRAKYWRAMVDGQQALQLKRRADAVRAFEAALVEKPDDFQAKAGLQKAKTLK
jgi:tetratricopeptide (TPR) repeat protein